MNTGIDGIAAPVRTRLPDRRTSRLYDLVLARWIVTVDVGFDRPGGQPLEVFLDRARRNFNHPGAPPLSAVLAGISGFDVPAMMNDFAVAISVALQHGIPPTALAKSMGRVPAAAAAIGGQADPGALARPDAGGLHLPASVFGASMDLLCEAAGQEGAR